MQSVLDACAAGRLRATPVVVISNNSKAYALERGRQAGLAAVHLSSATHPAPEALDQAIAACLREHAVDLVMLVGYMKHIGPAVLRAYRGRILNIHPALLPKFGGEGMYGHHVHEAVLAAGERESGASVHLVDEAYDHGTVLAQRRVPVLAGDTAEMLAARVLAEEHRLLVEVVEGIETGRIALPARVGGEWS